MRHAIKKTKKTEVIRVDVERAEEVGETIIKNFETDPRKGYYDEMATYMSQLRKFPVLKKHEDFEHLYKIYRDGNEIERHRARDLIVYGNIRLVIRIALRHTNRGVPVIDLMQEGVIGLMRALEKYELEKGFRFSTYAQGWIRQGMTRALQEINSADLYRVPVHARELINRVKKARAELYKQTGRWPKELQIYEYIKASGLKFSEEFTLVKVVQALRLIDQEGRPVYLDAPLYSSHDTGDSDESFGSNLAIRQPSIEAVVEARRLLADYQKAILRIEEAIDTLNPRAAMTMRLRLGLGDFDEMTLEEVGERYDITRERIRQIEAQALVQLQEKLGITVDELRQIIETARDLEEVANAI